MKLKRIILPPIVFLILLFLPFMYFNQKYEGMEMEMQTSNLKKIPIYVPQFVRPSKAIFQIRYNFTFDRVETLFAYRQREGLDQVVGQSKGTFQKVLKLMSWTRKQFEPGRPDPYPPIDAIKILDMIRSGKTGGFCAQYCYVLVQALQSFDIPARYVTLKGHEVCEVWINEFKKWICLDPMFNSYFMKDGEYLSAYEIYIEKNRKDIKIIGDMKKKEKKRYYGYFKVLGFWLKNNHVESPINFDKLQAYKIFYIDKEIKRKKDHALYTNNIIDLYFIPLKNSDHGILMKSFYQKVLGQKLKEMEKERKSNFWKRHF